MTNGAYDALSAPFEGLHAAARSTPGNSCRMAMPECCCAAAVSARRGLNLRCDRGVYPVRRQANPAEWPTRRVWIRERRAVYGLGGVLAHGLQGIELPCSAIDKGSPPTLCHRPGTVGAPGPESPARMTRRQHVRGVSQQLSRDRVGTLDDRRMRAWPTGIRGQTAAGSRPSCCRRAGAGADIRPGCASEIAFVPARVRASVRCASRVAGR